MILRRCPFLRGPPLLLGLLVAPLELGLVVRMLELGIVKHPELLLPRLDLRDFQEDRQDLRVQLVVVLEQELRLPRPELREL